jgi:HSP20 family molecular chaperone IbpA
MTTFRAGFALPLEELRDEFDRLWTSLTAAPEKVVWHRRERGIGSFERRIPLPVAVDPAGVEARLVDGVLSITCPKAAEAKPRRVEVRSA